MTLIQLRAKSMASGRLLALAESVVAEAQAAGARVIVNDRADIALMSGASGVHVGQEDVSPAGIRRIAGDRLLVGLSTHTARQVEAGCSEPVSYLAVGPVFQTATKGLGADPPVGLEGVRLAAHRAAASAVPLVAIGGITLERARAVREAGAASVAVIADLLVGEPRDRARRFLDALADTL